MIGFRRLRQAPGTSLAAIITLAIGIGATTAVVSFVSAVLSASSPAPDMDRLVALWSHSRGEADAKGLVSPADFLEWSSRSRSFAITAAWRTTTYNVSGLGMPVRVAAQSVTPGYFSLFGWQPTMGRAFTTEDTRPGAPPVVVVSHAYWQTRLGAPEDIIGQTLKLDGTPATVVGVLPRLPAVTGLFVPLSLDDQRDDRRVRSLFVFARLAPGVALEAARREMEQIGAVLEQQFPSTNRGWTVNVTPLQEEFVGPQARLVFGLLIAAVVVVLVIGCVNVANLLLARGIARRGEMAVRLALGASTGRITRQLLGESATLALLGGASSIVVSRWTLDLLVTLGEVDSPWIANGGLNARVLAVSAAVSLGAAILAGVMPALAARHTEIVPNLQGTGRSSVLGGRLATRVLVGAQIAMAVAMLVVGGLAARSLMALEDLELGFEIDNVLTASVTLPDAVGDAAAVQWAEEAVRRASRVPGVIEAGATSRLPFAGSRWNPNRGLQIEGYAGALDEQGLWAVDYVVTPGFIETLRIPLVAGRSFTAGDGADAPLVAIVNEAMARRYWPDGSVVGARLRAGDEPAGQWRTVVGVIANIRNDDADQPPAPYLYVPLAQRPQHTMTLVLRTASNPAALASSLRAAIASFDPDQPLYDLQTMRAVWEADLQGSRVLINVMMALALIALGLAGLGVWGIAAQSVGQRTREIGVRVALGATASQVAGLVARQGVTPIVAGLGVGVFAGLGLGQLMRSILFNVSPTDPVTIAATLAVLFTVAAAATVGPALRAARLDPLAALRNE